VTPFWRTLSGPVRGLIDPGVLKIITLATHESVIMLPRRNSRGIPRLIRTPKHYILRLRAYITQGRTRIWQTP
jgi:hypothetical protein